MRKAWASVMLFILMAVMLAGCVRTRTTSIHSGTIASPSAVSLPLSPPAVSAVPSAIPKGSSGAYPSVTGDEVPAPVITAEGAGQEIPTEQRTYCWGELGCADYAWGIRGMERITPSQTSSGERISIIYPYKQQPNQINLVRFTKEGQTEIVMEGNSFMAPLEQGVYYYGVLAYWKSEDGMHSAGDTSSVFKIEVTAGNRK